MIICVSFGIFYNLDDRLKVIVKGWIFELLRVVVMVAFGISYHHVRLIIDRWRVVELKEL